MNCSLTRDSSYLLISHKFLFAHSVVSRDCVIDLVDQQCFGLKCCSFWTVWKHGIIYVLVTIRTDMWSCFCESENAMWSQNCKQLFKTYVIASANFFNNFHWGWRATAKYIWRQKLCVGTMWKRYINAHCFGLYVCYILQQCKGLTFNGGRSGNLPRGFHGHTPWVPWLMVVWHMYVKNRK